MRALAFIGSCALVVAGCDAAPAAPLDAADSSIDAATIYDAARDGAAPDAAAADGGRTDADAGGLDSGARSMSVIGGFGNGGAALAGARYRVVDHGFDWGGPMCSGTRCVYGGFSR